MKPPKDAIDVVVAKLPPPGKKEMAKDDPDGDMDTVPEGGEGEAAAAGELWDALGIKPKDPGAAQAALSDFIRICSGKKYSDSGE